MQISGSRRDEEGERQVHAGARHGRQGERRILNGRGSRREDPEGALGYCSLKLLRLVL